MLISSLAFAAPAEDGLRLAARGLGISLADQDIGALYRSSWFTAGGAVVVPVVDQVALDVEVTYKRMSGVTRHPDTHELDADTASLELVPITALGLYEVPTGRGDLYLGLGWSMVTFRQYDVVGNDEHPSGQIAGTKVCPEVRLGTRIDTGLVEAPLAPIGGPMAEALEVELYVARRKQLSGGNAEGFDLSAWRFAGGLAVRF